jgi:RNA polymerase sigma-70 factor (ECF subfamily)
MVVDESGDQCREFEEEALPHLDRVYRVALLLAGSVAMAEDLTQETMLKAFRAWHQYERGTNARGWLLTILRHTFINQNRKAHRAGTTIDIDKIEPYSVLHEVQQNDPETVGTVKSRLFRARRGLRKVLSDYAYEMGYIEGRVEG